MKYDSMVTKIVILQTFSYNMMYTLLKELYYVTDIIKIHIGSTL